LANACLKVAAQEAQLRHQSYNQRVYISSYQQENIELQGEVINAQGEALGAAADF
jgi:hypothetical protein